jgi:hypothetical protein
VLPPPELVVEIHVPLRPAADVSDGEYPYPWIDDVADYLAERTDDGDVELYDDGEELGEEYVFFVCGGSETGLLGVAAEVAGMPFVPPGAYALVNDSEGDLGAGRRVELPVVP